MSTPQPAEDEFSPPTDYTPNFYVGHHETKRPLPVTDLVLRLAQDVGVSILQLIIWRRITIAELANPKTPF